MKSINEINLEIRNEIRKKYNFAFNHEYDSYANVLINYLLEELTIAKFKSQFVEHGNGMDNWIDTDKIKLKSIKGCRLQSIKIVDAIQLEDMNKRLAFDKIKVPYLRNDFTVCDIMEDTPRFTDVGCESYDTFLIAKFLVNEEGLKKVFNNDVLKELSDLDNLELLTEVNKRLLQKQ